MVVVDARKGRHVLLLALLLLHALGEREQNRDGRLHEICSSSSKFAAPHRNGWAWLISRLHYVEFKSSRWCGALYYMGTARAVGQSAWKQVLEVESAVFSRFQLYLSK